MSRITRSSKTAEYDSDSDNTNDNTNEIAEKIWEKIELKLTKWMQDVMKDMVKKSVDMYVSSPEFQHSMQESIEFDVVKQLDDQATQVSELESKIEGLTLDNKLLANQIDELEQYTRRTNIRIFGIPEDSSEIRENTDKIVTEFIKKELDLSLTDNDISRSHRVGKLSSRPRPIIVRLTRHNVKVQVLARRKLLKRKQDEMNKTNKENKKPAFSIQEDLTMLRRSILKYLRVNASDKVSKVWTIDGAIFFRPKGDPKIVERCTSLQECQLLLNKYTT